MRIPIRSLFAVFFFAILSASPSWAQSAPAEKQPVADFVDQAERAGLNAPLVFGGVDSKRYIIETTGTGVGVFDYDNDGWPDIFFVNGTTLDASRGKGPVPTNHLYRNNHDGTFRDVTEEAGVGDSGWGQGVCAGDYDNDGWTDLFVTYYGRQKLYRNLGNGRFKQAAEIAGVAGADKTWGTGCAFLDYDRDGLLDLVVSTYLAFDVKTAPVAGESANCMWKGAAVMCGPRGLKPSPNILYHNLGGGKFEDVSARSGITQTQGHYCFSISTLDYDQDGWPDIFVACDSTPSILYHNQKDGTFKDVAVLAGAAYNEDGREQAGMGSAVADFDGDGLLDIFKTNFSDDTSTVYRGNADASFTDVTFPAGLGLNTRYLGWGVAFADVDNDGWPDVLIANGHVYPEVDKFKLGSDYKEPKLLYHNLGNGKFEDISKTSGAGLLAATSARGLAVADFWNDGRLSAVISNMNDRPNLLVNHLQRKNHWIGLKLTGTKSNRSAIGARVEVHTGDRVLVNEVRSGGSYLSQNDMRLHFGLGAGAAVLDHVQVRWPSGSEERFDGLKIDQVQELTEGSGKPVVAKKAPTK